MASIRLGDLLVKAKVINEAQLASALAEQQRWGGRVGEILVRMNIVTEDMLVKALSKQLALPAVDLELLPAVLPHVRSRIPPEVARDLGVLPLQLRDEGKTLVVAMCEPQNIKHLDTLRSVSRCRIVPQLAGRQAIARAFARIYDTVGEVTESDSSFKVVNAQGKTLIKSVEEAKNQHAEQARTRPSQSTLTPVAAPPTRTSSTSLAPAAALPPSPGAAAGSGGKSPAEQLRAIEEAQRKEVGALKAMVELMIERGVFTREEYLSRVKR